MDELKLSINDVLIHGLSLLDLSVDFSLLNQVVNLFIGPDILDRYVRCRGFLNPGLEELDGVSDSTEEREFLLLVLLESIR